MQPVFINAKNGNENYKLGIEKETQLSLGI